MNNIRVTVDNYGSRKRGGASGEHIRVRIIGWKSDVFLIQWQPYPQAFRGWFSIEVKTS